jgi:hypothetical protein
VVTRRGIETAVVIGHEDYTRLVGEAAGVRPQLSAYLLSGTRAGAGELFSRIPLRVRGDV